MHQTLLPIFINLHATSLTYTKDAVQLDMIWQNKTYLKILLNSNTKLATLPDV